MTTPGGVRVEIGLLSGLGNDVKSAGAPLREAATTIAGIKPSSDRDPVAVRVGLARTQAAALQALSAAAIRLAQSVEHGGGSMVAASPAYQAVDEQGRRATSRIAGGG
ncbi:MAG: hypothetical protein DLM59_11285 [Pseudonocardiales bacterium]|nr:MAG: hypothetical protein DLM59_11285 [Pseudonocardiales bacterium]